METEGDRFGNTSAPLLSGLAAVPAGLGSRGLLASPQAHITALLSSLPRRPAAPEQREGQGTQWVVTACRTLPWPLVLRLVLDCLVKGE